MPRPRAGMRWGPPGLAAVGLVLALAGGAAGAASPRPEREPVPSWMWRGPDTTLDVFHYGAEGDGVADDTLAFQSALSAAGVFGCKTVLVGLGTFRINGNLTIPQSVSLVGVRKFASVHVADQSSWRPLDPDFFQGTDAQSVLLAYGGRGDEDGPAFISMEANSVLEGVVIRYPEQEPTGVPVPYPWAIDMCSAERRRRCLEDAAIAVGSGFCCTNNAVKDVELVNPYVPDHTPGSSSSSLPRRYTD